MIVFLNFAPFRFMGGAEKWAYETAQELAKHEKISLISVSEKIASIYSQIVLKRKFDLRVKSLKQKNISESEISYRSLIPFTNDWKLIKSKLKSADKIYLKFEVLELVILLYYCGMSSLNKTIAGIHTPYVYADPITFFDKLHNRIYSSKLSKNFLARFHKIHVITLRDYNLFTKGMNLKNAVFVANSIKVPEGPLEVKRDKSFNVLFVGELIPRKGVDILIKIIEKSDDKVQFNIVGNGPLANEIINLEKRKKNCKYFGYLNQADLKKLYIKSNVLLLPSRAEGFPLVYHEALNNGLLIVDSHDVNVGLPDDIEYSAPNNSPLKYAKILSKIKNNKKKSELGNRAIKYYRDNLAFTVVKDSIRKELFL